MGRGRPSKYTPELLKKARHYIDNWHTIPHQAFPSNIGLATYLGVRTSTVYDWAAQPEKAEFSDMLEEIQRIQHDVAMHKGLIGEYNANLVKLVLTKHGYTDRSLIGEDKENPMTSVMGLIDGSTKGID